MDDVEILAHIIEGIATCCAANPGLPGEDWTFPLKKLARTNANEPFALRKLNDRESKS